VSLVAARRGDKPNSSTSAAAMVVAAADHAQQAEVDYYKMTAAQQRCEESLQLAASPSLQVQRRQIRDSGFQKRHCLLKHYIYA
jgi:hypothetical protein